MPEPSDPGAPGDPGEPGDPERPADPAEPDELALAIFLAKRHKTSNFVFWRRDDWMTIYGVQVKRVNTEFVNVRVRPVGRGFLIP